MLVLTIPAEDFDDIVTWVLKEWEVKPFGNIFTDISHRMGWYSFSSYTLGITDKEEDEIPYVSNNLMVTIAEIVMILRGYRVDGETEAFVAEDLYKRFLPLAENNPYL